ncbi:MAG: DNA recombination protein RmuC [Fluviicola sp.]|nr:DNA recombination protein RmuC [Fluviicola sp.]
MTVTTLLLIISCIAVIATIYFVLKLQTANTNHQQVQQEKQNLSLELVSTRKSLELTEQQLQFERKKRSEDETQLKEQLNAIAKAVVVQGANTLKQENQQQLELLLQPFKEKLTSFEKEVRDQKEKGVQQYASMESLVKALSEQHQLMNKSAQNLADALKGEQKTQGNWGELALERILELSGLQAGIEFEKQFTIKDENGNQLRPDFVIHLPDEKHLVIDSKVSLTAFERFVNASNETEKTLALKAHLTSIHAHIKSLGEKNYAMQKQLNTPEFVLLFLPIESAFSLAIKEEPDIYTKAWEKRVVIVTPSTLLATLKTVESIWKQERQTRNALLIASEAGKLYDKFVGFVDDLQLVEKKQREALNAQESAMKKLHTGSGNLVGKIEQLKKLGAKTSKQLGNDLLHE